jgi:hypothetical protein
MLKQKREAVNSICFKWEKRDLIRVVPHGVPHFSAAAAGFTISFTPVVLYEERGTVWESFGGAPKH